MMPVRHRVALLAVFILVLTASCGSVPFPEPEPTGENVYTIFTYNVNGFDRGWNGSGVRPKEHDRIANIVKTNAVDVLGLNEILNGSASNGRTHWDVQDFESALIETGYPMSIFGFTAATDGYNNIAFFSRYSVMEKSEIGKNGPTRWTPQATRAVYRYRVTFPGDNQVWFYSCHLKSASDTAALAQRKSEAKNLAAYIRRNHTVKTDKIVIYGDMNTNNVADWRAGLPGAPQAATGTPGDCTMDYLELRDGSDPGEYFTALALEPGESYFKSTFAGSSGFPLDHIILSAALYNNHYVPDSVKVIGEGVMGPEGNPTDHYGVRAELYFYTYD